MQLNIDLPKKTLISLKDTIKQELDIIRKGIEPIDQVPSLAYSHKKIGNLRICQDPRHLNATLKRPHHKISTMEELSHPFTGAKIFSKLDVKGEYWSTLLDKDFQ